MVRYKVLIPILGFVFLHIAIILPCNAYEDTETHPEITKKAIEAEACIINDYFINYLGFPQGVKTKYGEYEESPTIVKLVMQGSTNEDDGLPRARNHFLNPIHNTGLDDERTIWVPVGPGPILAPIPVHVTGLPNLNWAMGYRLDDQGQEIETYDDCGVGDHSDDDCNDYSWRRARTYYYEALVSPTDESRNLYFVQFYERLGRLLHLLQDVSVPAHSRNDFFGHLDFTEIEGWNPLGWGGNLYEFWVKRNPEVVTRGHNNLPIPVFPKLEHYWDREVYNGADPNVTLPVNGEEQSGLAEYSNANFLSKYTMFTEDLPFGDRHYFPYPKKSSVVDPLTNQMPPEEITAEDGNVDRVFYVKKVQDGEEVQNFALAKYFWAGINLRLTDIGRYYRLAYHLDDTVHASYSGKLIPKAIGYTAGLINYFFRGTLEIAPPDRYLYALVDITNPDVPRQISEVWLKLKNTSPEGEEMTGGTIICMARYRKPKPAFSDLQFPSRENMEEEFSYSFSFEIPVTDELDVDSTTGQRKTYESRFTFYASDIPEENQAIPANVFDLELQMIYRGKLGQEEGAVAVGRVDVCEPAILYLWNNTDYFTILDEPFRAAINGDFDGDGEEDFFCEPITWNLELTFSEQRIDVLRPASPLINITLYGGSRVTYLLLQDKNRYYCRCYKENVSPGLTASTSETLMGTRNQDYLTIEDVAEEGDDVLGEDVSRLANYRATANKYIHRDNVGHEIIQAPIYGYLLRGKVLDSYRGLYMLHTNEWAIGATSQPSLLGNSENQPPGEKPYYLMSSPTIGSQPLFKESDE